MAPMAEGTFLELLREGREDGEMGRGRLSCGETLALREPDGGLAVRVFAEETGAPDLLFPEAANVLWKAHRRGLIDIARARRRPSCPSLSSSSLRAGH